VVPYITQVKIGALRCLGGGDFCYESASPSLYVQKVKKWITATLVKSPFGLDVGQVGIYADPTYATCT
jgi:hypothetical protein